jgi:threonine/homoserine/homoserine lactone efflux protein
MAFLPQFIDPSLPAGHQLALMCVVAVTMASVTDCGWAVLASAGRSLFLRSASAKWLGRISGLALIGGGVWLSLARRPG